MFKKFMSTFSKQGIFNATFTELERSQMTLIHKENTGVTPRTHLTLGDGADEALAVTSVLETV